MPPVSLDTNFFKLYYSSSCPEEATPLHSSRQQSSSACIRGRFPFIYPPSFAVQGVRRRLLASGQCIDLWFGSLNLGRCCSMIDFPCWVVHRRKCSWIRWWCNIRRSLTLCLFIVTGLKPPCTHWYIWSIKTWVVWVPKIVDAGFYVLCFLWCRNTITRATMSRKFSGAILSQVNLGGQLVNLMDNLSVREQHLALSYVSFAQTHVCNAWYPWTHFQFYAKQSVPHGWR